VDLREKFIWLQHLNFCIFTLWMPPCLGCPRPPSHSLRPLHATVLTSDFLTFFGSVASTLAQPLRVSKVGQCNEKGKTKQATFISNFLAHGIKSFLWPIRLARSYIDDVTIHPSLGSWINPTLKVCEHNRVAHASVLPDFQGKKHILPPLQTPMKVVHRIS